MGDKPDQIRDYRDLIVWQEAMNIAEDVYALTRTFPREEVYGISAQMRRAAVSIPSNIAEGFGRAQRKSFVQFLRIAQGSLKELETQIMLSERIGMLTSQDAGAALQKCERLGKRLVSFVRSLGSAEPE